MNLSLDDIIKKSKLKRGINLRSFSQNNKVNKKIGVPKVFKPDIKKVRLGRVRDYVRTETVKKIPVKFNPARKRALSISQVDNAIQKGNVYRRNNVILKRANKGNIQDARLKIGHKSLTTIPLSKLPTTVQKPADARMRIEARKSEKDRQMTVILPTAPTVLKGILRHSARNAYIDRDYVPDEDNDINFSVKSRLKNINNYIGSTPNDIIKSSHCEGDYMLCDEDTEPDIKYGDDFHMIRLTIANDHNKNTLNDCILTHDHNSSPLSILPPLMDVKRTIENTNRPLKLHPSSSRSTGVRDVLDPSGKLERNKPSINSRLGKKTSEVDGYKIIVSNLHVNVTSEDIKELFEDVGSLISAKVIRPGTAEVIYKLYEDALKAVDVYHNRQLDGQPMKCVLIKPSPSVRENLPSKNNNKASSILPDPNTIRKALFS